MSCFRPSAEHRRAARAMSLLEVMVSQTIALVVIAGMISMVGFMVTKLSAETKVSDAQVRLRQVTHLMLRDTQGVGGDVSQAGDLVVVTDGGVGAPDTFKLFKRDESVCGGSLNVHRTSGSVVKFDNIALDCPVDLDFCSEKELEGRSAVLMGEKRQAAMTGHSATGGGACQLNFPKGKQLDDVIEGYNLQYGTTENSIANVLKDLEPTQVLFGSVFIYRLNGTTLQRSTDNGLTFVNILDDVYDLQLQRVFLLADGLTIKQYDVSTGDEPAELDGATFLGLRIGLMTFGVSPDGLTVAPPGKFGNRDHSAAPKNRRYRGSFVFAAARNRS